MVEVNAHITMSVDCLTDLFIIFILLFLVGHFYTNLVGSKWLVVRRRHTTKVFDYTNELSLGMYSIVDGTLVFHFPTCLLVDEMKRGKVNSVSNPQNTYRDTSTANAISETFDCGICSDSLRSFPFLVRIESASLFFLFFSLQKKREIYKGKKKRRDNWTGREEIEGSLDSLLFQDIAHGNSISLSLSLSCVLLIFFFLNVIFK